MTQSQITENPAPNLVRETSQPMDAGGKIGWLFEGLSPISLARTNELASMQNRLDNKYYVDFDTLSRFVSEIGSNFAVMEISGTRQFTYRSCYYDQDYACYYQHHQGRRQRFKARTREYVDGGGMKFFEVKLKGKRGRTEKHRIAADFVIAPEIGGECLAMLQDVYTRNYHKPMTMSLTPSLIVDYKRCTLVALDGGERVTLDYQISFERPSGEDDPVRVGNGFIIIETKSADGRGISDRALKRLNVKKAANCSKYCIGVNLIGATSKQNVFRDTIRHVERQIVAHGQVGPS